MKLLFVDDEAYNLDLYQRIFSDSKFECLSTNNLEEAEKFCLDYSPHIVLLDLKFGRKDSSKGLQFLKETKEKYPLIELIVISGSSSNLTKAQALIDYKAFDYIEKPIRSQYLKIIVERAAEKVKLLQENYDLKAEAKQFSYGIVGKSDAMQQLRRLVEKLASVNSPVLIEGKTGSGKEVTARAIHLCRKAKQFLAIDCGTLNENLFESQLFGHKKGSFTSADSDQQGLFELIGTGTLFLDEVENLSLQNQQKLLRCLEEKRFMPLGGSKEKDLKAKLLFGTNQNLESCVEEGKFRRDLFHRINILSVQLPDLNERREDISMLIEYFNQKLSEQLSISKLIPKSVYDYLKKKEYKGNLRELRNIIERALVLGKSDTHILLADVTEKDTKKPDKGRQSLKDAETEAKEKAILDTLARNQNHIVKSALDLEISPRHLKRLMNDYGIEA